MARVSLEKRLGLDRDDAQRMSRLETRARSPELGRVTKDVVTAFVRREMVNFSFDDTGCIPVDEMTIRGEAMERKLASLLLGMSRLWDVATNQSWFVETLEHFQRLRGGEVVGTEEQRQQVASSVAGVLTKFFDMSEGESEVLGKIVKWHFAEKYLEK